MHKDLSEQAQLFLLTQTHLSALLLRKMRAALIHFHDWLGENQISVEALTDKDLKTYSLDYRKKCLPGRWERQRNRINAYLSWLHHNHRLPKESGQLPQKPHHPRKEAPKSVSEFIKVVALTKSANTCKTYYYQTSLFHQFLKQHHIGLSQLNRYHLQMWMREMSLRGLAPSTKWNALVNVRVYLRWLHETNRLRCDPDDLIRSSDLPKLPNLLPRPLPPDIDEQLQSKLAHSKDIRHKGLLLMRHTGLRIGEMMALPFHCVTTDFSGNHFLKVPLGKLNTERLVPINAEQFQLVKTIQAISQKHWNNPSLCPERLVVLKNLRRSRYETFRRALREICLDIPTDKPITSHQMRHSYATTLLNAGVSLISLMKLLGHHDFHMTLRYASVTQQTVREEYCSAQEKLSRKYRLPGVQTASRSSSDPHQLLNDLISIVRKNGARSGAANPKKVSLLIKRIRHLQSQIPTFPSSSFA